MNKVSFTGNDISVFKWASNKSNEQKSTNPFASAFKSNALTSDVFQSSKATTQDVLTIKDSLRRHADNLATSFAGTVNQTRETFSRMFQPVVSFTSNLKSQASDLWRRANETQISFSGLTKTNQSTGISSEVRDLMSKPVSELNDMLVSRVTIV